MKMKSLMLLAVAVGCGLVAMLGVQQVLSGDRGVQIEKVRVLVARTDIDPGVPLDKDNVVFRDVPKDAVPENAVTKPEEYEERALTSRAFANQVICKPQLGEKGVFGATIDIPVGMRVVTIPVNSTTAHSGLMKPGDRVDVIATFQLQRPGFGTVTHTRTILEYIEVWATDSTRIGVEEASKQMNTKESVKNVSLLVNMKQATVLKLAESKGTIHLALRSKTDTLRSEATDLEDSGLESLQALFDDRALANRPVQKEEPKLETEKPSFGDFLQKADEEKPESTRPTWKVVIYSGGEKTVEEVELPEADLPASSPTSLRASDGGWMRSVAGFFGLPVNGN
jgi:pilus assembly protein CpaB